MSQETSGEPTESPGQGTFPKPQHPGLEPKPHSAVSAMSGVRPLWLYTPHLPYGGIRSAPYGRKLTGAIARQAHVPRYLQIPRAHREHQKPLLVFETPEPQTQQAFQQTKNPGPVHPSSVNPRFIEAPKHSSHPVRTIFTPVPTGFVGAHQIPSQEVPSSGGLGGWDTARVGAGSNHNPTHNSSATLHSLR